MGGVEALTSATDANRSVVTADNLVLQGTGAFLLLHVGCRRRRLG